MVILIRCNDIFSDPRAVKYVKFLQEKGIEHKLIGWDRDGNNVDEPNAVFWRRKAGYNVGSFSAVKNRIGWMWFVFRQLMRLKKENIVLHGCDADSAFPAACYKLFNRKAKLIFDIFDWFSATLYDQKSYVLKAFKVMERFTVNHSDKIILCEPERIEQIPFKVEASKISVLPNIPYFDDDSFLIEDAQKKFSNELLTFSYVGGFCAERCLYEIIQLAEEGVINLAIAGFGDKDLEDKLEGLKDCPNIKYYGRVAYQDGLNISLNSDVMYAMYSKVNPNHVYAAPNKYYESMFLGKALFSTKGTIVEKKVLINGTGYVSEESVEDIKEAISKITKESVVTCGDNAHRLWIEKYGSYTSDWLNGDYSSFIK